LYARRSVKITETSRGRTYDEGPTPTYTREQRRRSEDEKQKENPSLRMNGI